MAGNPRLNASCRQIRPFPFCKPVSTASPLTLEFRHSSAALWTDQVDDGRDDVPVRLARQCVSDAHNRSPIQRSESERAADTGQTTDVPRGFLRSEAALRTGWLRSPCGFQWLPPRSIRWECKLIANPRLRRRAANTTVRECER